MWFRLLQLIFFCGSWTIVLRMVDHVSLRPMLLGRYSVLYGFLLACAVAVAVAVTSTILPSVYARLHRLRFHILLLLASTFIFGAGLLEIAIREFDLFGASFYREVTRCMLELEPDPDVAYRHRYGLRATYQGVEVSINEIGLRDRPTTLKSPSRRRILLLGDSVTFGWGVPIESTYGRQLEATLARAGVEAETVNSGVCGYNTIQEFRFLASKGLAIDPDIVTLLFVDNDVQPVEPIKRERTVALWQDTPPSAFSRVLRESWLYRILYHLVPFVIKGPPAFDTSAPAWRESMESVAGIDDYCRSRGIPFVPFLYRVSRNAQTDAILADLTRVGASRGFRVYDTQPWFAQIRPKDVVNSVVDAHPNAAGHRILADGIAKVLTALPAGRGTP